ncbi:ubl carboxyl-terminal hydrolase 18 isoform X2 [Nelusetta ayraudi]|uniref:ubl carboxyl-terminal hydrolase 18 isoform X2 n=1 Tax=Nelusetta ayraudi TaxID=303726 RepID=UPI003F714BB5
MAFSPLCWVGKLTALRSSDLGMRGLTNYCLSCCVNTLLQTFSATWELPQLLDRWDAGGVQEDDRNVPLQLKKVLATMRSDSPEPVHHHDLLHCLDRNRVRLNKQHDADEVFLSVLNFLLQQMDNRSLALEIQNLYKIRTETVLQCLECGSVQTHDSYQLSLALHIREDRNALEDCLASFFKHQELRGANCCFCPKCQTKTPSKQGLRLRSLPRILCLNLKRFRRSLFGTRKLDCIVAFPESFDFSQVAGEAFAPDFARVECRYTLYAVVVHSGFAMCGHYTAFVRHVTQQWYYADDSRVKKVTWEDVKTAYGGDNGDTAYMLMYRRSCDQEAPKPE